VLQVYDRVVPSSSEVTLLMLTLGLVLAYLTLAGLDAARARVLTRASVRLDQRIAPRIMTAIIDRPAAAGGARSQLLRDFDGFRQFISGTGIHAIFDLPWAPIYIAVIFMLHWTLGAFALACGVVLVLMALANEWLVRSPLSDANAAAAQNYSFTEMSLRNVEVIRAMDMRDGMLGRWTHDRDRMLERQVVASDRGARMQGAIRFLRLSMQSVILGLGAYLVIEHSATAGAMFAASLLLGVVYIFGPLRCGIDLHSISPYWLFFALSLNWAGDIAALYVGRLIGRHKMAPHVSPAKSWEGAVASVAASVIYGALYFPRLLPAVPLMEALALTAIANIAGQFGDLCESAMKRGAGVKDSGSLLPGHGGWLDRLDSSLFALPVVYFVVSNFHW